MPHAIPPIDIADLIQEAALAARRLHRKLCLPAADIDDLHQDLLVDLIRRLPGYDDQRGSIGAFANVVLRNQASRIAVQHHHQRRTQGGTMLSLDAPSAGGVEPLGRLLAESEGLSAWLGQNRDPETEAELRQALGAALARLSESDRRFCTALTDRSVTALAAEGFGSRSALYRRIADLRHVLTAYGLGPGWDDFAAA